MGVPVVDESNWKRRHWPPKQLLVDSFVTAESARAPVAVSVKRRRAVSMLRCRFGAECCVRLNAVGAGARGQCCWESCSKHSCKRELCNALRLCGRAQMQICDVLRVSHCRLCVEACNQCESARGCLLVPVTSVERHTSQDHRAGFTVLQPRGGHSQRRIALDTSTPHTL